jgi:peptidoglycan/LPS O-acetylase OafA/YrhL
MRARITNTFVPGKSALGLTMNDLLRWFTTTLSVLAVAASAALLASDVKLGLHLRPSSATLSAAPLLLIGISFLIFQAMIRPRWSELLKNVLLAGAFLLWGAVQLMPQNALAPRLANLVIALYVVDLAWVMLSTLGSKRQPG